MTNLNLPASTEPIPADVDRVETVKYVDWASVLAATVVVVAMAVVLFAFAATLGLSLATPGASGPSATALGYAGIIFFALVQIYIAGAGGYLAARMRPRADTANRTEVRFRDGFNGLIVWALTLLLTVYLAFSAASIVTRSAAQLMQSALGAATVAAGAAVSAVSAVAEQSVDLLFSEPQTRAATTASTGAQTGAEQTGVIGNLPVLTDARREEIMRYITPILERGSLTEEQRAYLGRQVTRYTGLQPDQATQRVSQVVSTAATQVTQAVNEVREATAFTGFWTAFVLLLSGIVAWWGASLGGDHRDRNAVRPS